MGYSGFILLQFFPTLFLFVFFGTPGFFFRTVLFSYGVGGFLFLAPILGDAIVGGCVGGAVFLPCGSRLSAIGWYEPDQEYNEQSGMN